ncbi:M20 aminoacylase family protein [Prosthecodimorpha staleyi]|uniref:Amidohydrolase n=1 Tax=Prosthecodimorpha staleyi TaxID=2840188 RepID=A0A947DA04_9HYPH|nr:M20 aminoacylase family protein [Prosthecodimorpha staleyi]MBT9291067.1 amidohydrolase [Prosthecodimorpha staleyi]
MPIVNSLNAAAEEVAGWRRHLHRHPELGYAVEGTAAYVADKLTAFGVDAVATGIGRTGVVGVIHGRAPGRTIALRADMDALPILETSGKDWASEVPGRMHACGHDGHTAMLLAAARHLAETRNFAGTAVLVFQPAEEAGGGAKAMIDDGLMTRFGVDAVYGMHNAPGIPVGRFALRSGAFLASCDTITIDLEGVGGHAATPHLCCDTVLAGAAIVQAVQHIVSRTIDPIASAVISITCFNAGFTDNVIPQTGRLVGTVRTLSPAVRDHVEARLRQVIETTAAAYGVKAVLDYNREYPVLVNHEREAGFAAEVARDVAGADAVNTAMPPELGSEDFAFMLEERPGAFIFVGNGNTAGLHHPAYDFDDAAIPYGASYWVRLVERALPA